MTQMELDAETLCNIFQGTISTDAEIRGQASETLTDIIDNNYLLYLDTALTILQTRNLEQFWTPSLLYLSKILEKHFPHWTIWRGLADENKNNIKLILFQVLSTPDLNPSIIPSISQAIALVAKVDCGNFSYTQLVSCIQPGSPFFSRSISVLTEIFRNHVFSQGFEFQTSEFLTKLDISNIPSSMGKDLKDLTFGLFNIISLPDEVCPPQFRYEAITCLTAMMNDYPLLFTINIIPETEKPDLKEEERNNAFEFIIAKLTEAFPFANDLQLFQGLLNFALTTFQLFYPFLQYQTQQLAQFPTIALNGFSCQDPKFVEESIEYLIHIEQYEINIYERNDELSKYKLSLQIAPYSDLSRESPSKPKLFRDFIGGGCQILCHALFPILLRIDHNQINVEEANSRGILRELSEPHMYAFIALRKLHSLNPFQFRECFKEFRDSQLDIIASNSPESWVHIHAIVLAASCLTGKFNTALDQDILQEMLPFFLTNTAHDVPRLRDTCLYALGEIFSQFPSIITSELFPQLIDLCVQHLNENVWSTIIRRTLYLLKVLFCSQNSNDPNNLLGEKSIFKNILEVLMSVFANNEIMTLDHEIPTHVRQALLALVNHVLPPIANEIINAIIDWILKQLVSFNTISHEQGLTPELYSLLQNDYILISDLLYHSNKSSKFNSRTNYCSISFSSLYE